MDEQAQQAEPAPPAIEISRVILHIEQPGMMGRLYSVYVQLASGERVLYGQWLSYGRAMFERCALENLLMADKPTRPPKFFGPQPGGPN